MKKISKAKDTIDIRKLKDIRETHQNTMYLILGHKKKETVHLKVTKKETNIIKDKMEGEALPRHHIKGDFLLIGIVKLLMANLIIVEILKIIKVKSS